MPRSTDWTHNETLAAFHIYLQLPFELSCFKDC